MLAHHPVARLLRQRRQHAPVFGQVVDHVQQRLLAGAQVGEDIGLAVEEIVDQFRRHDRIVGRVEAPVRQLDVGQAHGHEIMVKVAAQAAAGRSTCAGFPARA